MPARAALRLDPGKPERMQEVVENGLPMPRGIGFQISDFGFAAWDRILAAAAPGMAAADPADSQAPALQRAVRLDRAQRVFGTARREAAAPQGPEQQGLRRGNHPAIQAHAKN